MINAIEARKLANEGIENTRLRVVSRIDKAIENAAKRHLKNVIITLTSRGPDSLQVTKANYIYGAPVDKKSIETYLDYLKIAGFVVTELYSDTTEPRLLISWEEE